MQEQFTSRDHEWGHLPRARFVMNLNNKLHNRALSTIRTPEKKWRKGAELAVVEGPEAHEWFHGVAVVVQVHHTSLREITDEQALMDCGYLRPDLVRLLYQYYGDYLRNNGGEDAKLLRVLMVKKDDYFVRHDAPLLGTGHEPKVHRIVPDVPIGKEIKAKAAPKTDALVLPFGGQG